MRTYQRWKKKKEENKINYRVSHENLGNTMRVNKNPETKERDNAVSSWLVKALRNGSPITGPILQQKAKQLNADIGGSDKFKASGGWLTRFKNRNDIRNLKITGKFL